MLATIQEDVFMAETERVYCNRCGGQRRHELLHKEEFRWEKDIGNRTIISGANIYELLKCRGCDHVVLRHKSWFSEDIDPNSGRPIVTTIFYPPATYRKQPVWLTQLLFVSDFDDSIQTIVEEIYVALQNDAPRLATMGIRALLEEIVIDKVGDKGTFRSNLDAFQEAGFISKSQRQVIEPVIDAGHATIHRGFRPNKKDIGLLMDIAESVIESIYINAYRVKGFKEKIPPRRNKRGAKVGSSPARFEAPLNGDKEA
jgi:hypothetical protein